MFPSVGVGLAFCLNAAPLLMAELAYPTQVSDDPKLKVCGSADGT